MQEIDFGNIEASHYESPTLEKFRQSLKAIERFEDSEVEDNVYEHTLRAIELAMIIGASDRVKKMLSLHDIPETELGDVPVSMEEAYTIEDQIRVARELLSPEEAVLVEEFILSEAYLKGLVSIDSATPEGVLASVVDRVEGNMHFHTWMANAGDYSRSEGEYTINQIETYIEKLDAMSPCEEINLAKMVLRSQISYMNHIYGRETDLA